MSTDFNLAQVVQLTEIQNARRRRGQPGIGSVIDELIRRLTSGGVAGKTDDVRTAQAKLLWDLGVGRELGMPSFETYLATIPQIPAELAKDDADYPLLVLVEPRVGLKRLCGLGNIESSGGDNMFVEHDGWHGEFAEPAWIRVQDGRKNRNRAVRDCRASFAQDELGLTALQGVCTYLQHPESVVDTDREDGHVMDLPSSVRRDKRDAAAYLKVCGGRAELRWYFDYLGHPRYGSASRRKCRAL